MTSRDFDSHLHPDVADDGDPNENDGSTQIMTARAPVFCICRREQCSPKGWRNMLSNPKSYASTHMVTQVMTMSMHMTATLASITTREIFAVSL